MTLEARKEYLNAIRIRYKNATKLQKGVILDEFCNVCNYTRKHAIRLLNGKTSNSSRRPGPKAIYTEEVVTHLERLWRAMNKMCSTKMVAALPIWLDYDKHPKLDENIRRLLLQVSSSSIDRLLRPYKKSSKGLSSTCPGPYLKSKIPIELLKGYVKEPGHIEADTVAHCGNTLYGKFANTLTVTDLYSGWTENRATWTKTSQMVIDSLKEIRIALPFAMRSFASDNGSEFINADLVRYFENKNYGFVRFRRRRPYKKNDAAHVEQKNDTHVRQLFGYERVDHRDLVSLMNEIYRESWNPLLNYFCPVMKLQKKIRVGGRIKKIYDVPKTPYDRLMESSSLDEKQKDRLKLKKELMDPFKLKEALDRQLELFKKTMRRHQSLISEEIKKTA